MLLMYALMAAHALHKIQDSHKGKKKQWRIIMPRLVTVLLPYQTTGQYDLPSPTTNYCYYSNDAPRLDCALCSKRLLRLLDMPLLKVQTKGDTPVEKGRYLCKACQALWACNQSNDQRLEQACCVLFITGSRSFCKHCFAYGIRWESKPRLPAFVLSTTPLNSACRPANPADKKVTAADSTQNGPLEVTLSTPLCLSRRLGADAIDLDRKAVRATRGTVPGHTVERVRWPTCRHVCGAEMVFDARAPSWLFSTTMTPALSSSLIRQGS